MSLISVKDFATKYSVNSSTIYYMVNNKIVKAVKKKTKYGKKVVFNEEVMLAECKFRMIIETTEEDLLSIIKSRQPTAEGHLPEVIENEVPIEELPVTEPESDTDKIEINIQLDPSELEQEN